MGRRLDPAVVGIPTYVMQELGVEEKTLIRCWRCAVLLGEILEAKKFGSRSALHQNRPEACRSTVFDITRQNNLCQLNPSRVRQELYCCVGLR